MPCTYRPGARAHARTNAVLAVVMEIDSEQETVTVPRDHRCTRTRDRPNLTARRHVSLEIDPVICGIGSDDFTGVTIGVSSFIWWWWWSACGFGAGFSSLTSGVVQWVVEVGRAIGGLGGSGEVCADD